MRKPNHSTQIAPAPAGGFATLTDEELDALYKETHKQYDTLRQRKRLIAKIRRQRRAIKVRVRGVVYANVREAAAANNVDVYTVYNALSRDRTDYIGLGRIQPTPINRGKSITIAGIKHASIKHAAEACGVTRYAMNAYAKGTATEKQREKIYAGALKFSRQQEVEPA